MSRFLRVDSTTGAILSTIREVDPTVAVLYAEAGEIIMAITSDTGAFVDDGAVEVDLTSFEIKTKVGGTVATGFESSVAEEITVPE